MEELKRLLAELAKTFEEYKSTNDARLKEVESKGKADPLLDEKLAKMDEKMAALSAEKKKLEESLSLLEAKENRPGKPDSGDQLQAEHKEAFMNWARKGNDAMLQDLARKGTSINVTTGSEGEYAVPTQISTQIYSLLTQNAPMRGVCRVIQVGTEDYSELVNTHGATSGWVGETDARTNTNAPELAVLTPYFGEIYAMPKATQKSLDDIFFNVEGFLSEEVARDFAEKENAAFVSGDGTKKPKGILAYTTAATADKSRAFGTLEYVKTGAAAAFGDTTPQDVLMDLVYKLKAGHRMKARWMLAGATLATIRKWKDKDDNYLWQPGMVLGEPDKILGYPVTENDDWDLVGANKYPIAFGDFWAAYTIVDRIGIRMLRDPYTAKPYVQFYTTKRVGGFLKDSEAIKLVKCSA